VAKKRTFAGRAASPAASPARRREALVEDGQWERGRTVAWRNWDHRHPRQPDVLALRLAVAAQLGAPAHASTGLASS